LLDAESIAVAKRMQKQPGAGLTDVIQQTQSSALLCAEPRWLTVPCPAIPSHPIPSHPIPSHPIPSLQSQSAKGGGFISDGKNFVTIKSLKILGPSDAGAAIATVNVENE